MRILFLTWLLLLFSFAYSASLPFGLNKLPGENSKGYELEEQLFDQQYGKDQSTDLYDDSSPVESRYEDPESSSSEEENDYDAALGEILEDIVETLQSHPEIMKDLVHKSPNSSNRPEAGKEIIDENYPRTDASEESRELDEYLNNIHEAETEEDGPISNIQEGGQDDPMFDFERLQEPKDQQMSQTDYNVENNAEYIDGQNTGENLSKMTETDINTTSEKDKEDTRLSEMKESSLEDLEKQIDARSPKYRVDIQHTD